MIIDETELHVRSIYTLVFATLLCLLSTICSRAYGKRAPPQPVPVRLATSDVAFLGEVTRWEDKKVMAKPYPGATTKVEHVVAVVKVEKAIRGAKGLTHVRIALVPGGTARRPAGAFPNVGEKALFFVPANGKESFYVAQPFNHVICKEKNAQFEKQVKEAELAGRLLNDPLKGLKSKNADERFVTAAMLITQYRTPKPGQTAVTPIDKAESELILKALAEADWKARPYNLYASTYFYRLNPTVKDGWTRPKDFRQFEPEAKLWLTKNAGTFRIQRYVFPANSSK